VRRAIVGPGAAVLSLLTVFCSQPDNPLAPGGRPVAAAIEVTPGTAVVTAVGASLTLRATVRDANGNSLANVSVTWGSNDASIVKVDETGKATAMGPGEATVTARTAGLTGVAAITVSALILNTAWVSGVDQQDLVSSNDSATAKLIVTVEQ